MVQTFGAKSKIILGILCVHYWKINAETDTSNSESDRYGQEFQDGLELLSPTHFVVFQKDLSVNRSNDKNDSDKILNNMDLDFKSNKKRNKSTNKTDKHKTKYVDKKLSKNSDNNVDKVEKLPNMHSKDEENTEEDTIILPGYNLTAKLNKTSQQSPRKVFDNNEETNSDDDRSRHYHIDRLTFNKHQNANLDKDLDTDKSDESVKNRNIKTIQNKTKIQVTNLHHEHVESDTDKVSNYIRPKIDRVQSTDKSNDDETNSDEMNSDEIRKKDHGIDKNHDTDQDVNKNQDTDKHLSITKNYGVDKHQSMDKKHGMNKNHDNYDQNALNDPNLSKIPEKGRNYESDNNINENTIKNDNLKEYRPKYTEKYDRTRNHQSMERLPSNNHLSMDKKGKEKHQSMDKFSREKYHSKDTYHIMNKYHSMFNTDMPRSKNRNNYMENHSVDNNHSLDKKHSSDEDDSVDDEDSTDKHHNINDHHGFNKNQNVDKDHRIDNNRPHHHNAPENSHLSDTLKKDRNYDSDKSNEKKTFKDRLTTDKNAQAMKTLLRQQKESKIQSDNTKNNILRSTKFVFSDEKHEKHTTSAKSIYRHQSKYLRAHCLASKLQELEKSIFKKRFSKANITVETLARTAEYNDIVLLKVTQRKKSKSMYFRSQSKYVDEIPEKKIIFIVHGLSVMGMHNLACLDYIPDLTILISYYLKHLSRFDIFIIPMANPDGYTYGVIKEDRLHWNKNMSPQDSCYGVALDRNFDIGWNASRNVTSCSPSYPGPSPFSEIESRVVRDVLHYYGQRIIAYIHVHAGTVNYKSFKGEAILYPKGYTDSQTNEDRYIDLKGEIEETMRNASFQVMSVTVDSLRNWYGRVSGTSVDYASTVYGIPYALEFVMQLYDSEHESYQELALIEIWSRLIYTTFRHLWNNRNRDNEDK